MDMNLKNLRKDMTGTVLKEVRFDEDQIERIRGKIRNLPEPKNQWFLFAMRTRFNAILSTGLCLVMVVCLFFFAAQKGNWFHQEASSSQQNGKNALLKKEIKNKMLNSMDYFSSAIGTMVSTNYRDNQKVTYQYHVRLGGRPASNVVTIGTNGKVLERVVSNQKYTLTIWPDYKSYLKTKTMAYKKKERDANGYRMDYPPVGNADMSLFPQKMATNYLLYNQKWSILNRDERLLNRDVTVIGGTIDHYPYIKIKGKSFKFWVDKQTGILLKMAVYDKKGTLVFGFETKKLQLNQKIPQSVFEAKPPKGYQNDQGAGGVT